MVPSYILFTSLLCISISQSQRLSQDQNTLSVTREENNLDDSITEIFNLCKCVIFYTCDEENFIIPQDRLASTQVRFGQPPMRNIFRIRCSNEYYYCCKNRTDTRTEYLLMPNLRSISSSSLQCGQPRSSVTGRLIDEFPWVVAIYYNRGNNVYSFKCGGSLIHPQVVMTVQECIYSFAAGDLRIVMGREVLGQNAKFSSVSKIIKHEAYSPGGPYDLALLILQTPSFSTTTICLPRPSQKFNGLSCTAVDWSGTAQSGSPKLKKTTLSIVDPQRCTYLLQNAALGPNFQMNPSYLCAGRGHGADACGNSGGSPFMCRENDGVYVQVGIIPKGPKCGRVDLLSLHTNVVYLTDWISQKIVAENL